MSEANLSVKRLVHRVRSWEFRHTTPAHGKLMVSSEEKRCAVDYGRKIRIFIDRDPKWVGTPARPHQFRKNTTFKTNQKRQRP